MFYLSAELGISAPQGGQPGSCRGRAPSPQGQPGLWGLLPWALPLSSSLQGGQRAPVLLISGWPPSPLFALHAFKTLQNERPVSDPRTRFWSGTRTFSATPRLRRPQQNRGQGPVFPSLLWVLWTQCGLFPLRKHRPGGCPSFPSPERSVESGQAPAGGTPRSVSHLPAPLSLCAAGPRR